MDRSGQIQAWIALIKAGVDLEGKRSILYRIAESDEWKQLGADLRTRRRRCHQGSGTVDGDSDSWPVR